MTFAEVADRYAPRPEDIVGPWSPWPRRRPRRRGTRAVAFASSLTAAAFLLHTGLPLQF